MEVAVEVAKRRRLCQNPNEYCHAGGLANTLALLHPNYGLPCVVEVGQTRCVYCGALCKETQ